MFRLQVAKHSAKIDLNPVQELEATALFDDFFEKEGLDKGLMDQFVIRREWVTDKDGKQTGGTKLVSQGIARIYMTPEQLGAACKAGSTPQIFAVKEVKVAVPVAKIEAPEANVIPLKKKVEARNVPQELPEDVG